MTNCEKIAPLISEYVSGTLDAKNLSVVQSHIGQCAECAKLASDFQSLTEALGNVPSKQPSLNFDGNLAKRLAELPKPSAKPHLSFSNLRSVLSVSPRRVIRQTLAFTAVVALGGLFLALNMRSATVDNSDILLAHCVQQHRIDAAAQPLSDLSAQALSARPDTQDPKTDALSDINDSENL